MTGTGYSPRGTQRSHTPDQEVAQRRAEVVRLRRSGMKHIDIAEELGIGVGEDHKNRVARVGVDLKVAWQQSMADLTEEVDAWRAQELDRLDALQYAIWDQAIAGNLPAIHSVLSIMDRRARYLNLYQTSDSAATLGTAFLDAALQGALNTLRERNNAAGPMDIQHLSPKQAHAELMTAKAIASVPDPEEEAEVVDG